MFNFVRKKKLFKVLDRGLPKKLKAAAPFHMKTTQDCVVYEFLEDARGLDIAEIGGGDSRLLRAISKHNRCVNIEPFDGNDGGPSAAVKIPGVKNIRSLLGESSNDIADESFDIVFSISVVEHVPIHELDAFFHDGMRILKPGGLWLHAIDVYLGENPVAFTTKRVDIYRQWANTPGVTEPVGYIFDGPAKFHANMASNPDNVMHAWGHVAPDLVDLRRKTQGVSALVASRKIKS